MKRIICISLMLLCICAGASAQRLVILHVNDTHSHFDPLRDGTGGIIERAAFVDSVRRAEGKKNVLVLHAGDFNQGTSYYSVLGGELEVNMVNAMKYDCITLGNHEFDNGIEDLTMRVRKLNCPVVCSNYDFSPFVLGIYVKPYTIVRRGGMKIGIMGALTDVSTVVSRETADRMHRYDTPKVLSEWAAYLKNEKKCDLVIALTHLGYDGADSDCELVPQLENVDFVIGGHSHTDLTEMDTTHTDRNGKTVPIVQDGCWGLNIGVIKVY